MRVSRRPGCYRARIAATEVIKRSLEADLAQVERGDAAQASTLPVITEVCHFLNVDGKVALLTWVGRNGLSLQPIGTDDLPEITAVMPQCRAFNLVLP